MITIKSATTEDLEVVHQLAYEIWPDTYRDILSEEQLKYMLGKMYSIPSLRNQLTILKHEFTLVLENETPVGFASFSPYQDERLTYRLNKIYVLPSQQGKNIGKQLLAYIIDQIKNHGAAKLQLNVNRNNKALHFYKKQGFKIIREDDIDIGEGYFMNDFVMEKKI